MLRHLVLALLVANILVWGWHRWVAPRPVADPLAPAGQRDPRLVMLQPGNREAPAAASAELAKATPDREPPPAEARTSPASVVPPRCLRLGPFGTVAEARRASEQAADLGLEARVSSESGEIWVGHWVQVAGLPDRSAAESALDRLARGGLGDAYIVASEPDFRLSLGVFRARDGAERVAAAARRAGFEPVTTDRFRPGTEHWLTVAVAPGASPELAGLAGGGAQILRPESVQCPPALGAPRGD